MSDCIVEFPCRISLSSGSRRDSLGSLRLASIDLRLEEVDAVLGIELHDRLLPILGVPLLNRVRRGLPLRFCVWTRSTLTLNNSSTARRTSSFVAMPIDLERVGVVPRRAVHSLFGHQRPQMIWCGSSSDVDSVASVVGMAIARSLLHRLRSS